MINLTTNEMRLLARARNVDGLKICLDNNYKTITTLSATTLYLSSKQNQNLPQKQKRNLLPGINQNPP